MKIFLTGRDGFIGAKLISALQTQGHDVYAMQNDLLDFHLVEQEILQASPDIVVHLAARTEVENSFYEQISFSSVNYVGTVNLIESACKLPKLPYFLFASTMEVYGWQPVSDKVRSGGQPCESDVFDESTVPHPNAPYSLAKLACEKYLEYANRVHGLDYCILRQTNAYGRTENNFFVTEQIIWQMLNNAREINLGYETPYRNFIYIDDVISAWTAVIENKNQCKNQLFTMGPSCAIKIKDHANNIANVIGWNGKINWNTRPIRPGEIYYLCSHHQRLTAATGWWPKVSYEDGLNLTVSAWRHKLAN